MKKIVYSFFTTLLLTLLLSTARASINEVSCTSEFSSTCNQCFKESTNMYPGYGFNDLSDTWFASGKGEYIYPDENPTPVTINPFYTSGELEQKLNFGYSYASLSDGNFNNGEIRTDGDGAYYIDFQPNSVGKILVGNDSFIKFARISDSIKSNGRNKPLLEFQYNFNYYPNFYNNGNIWEDKKHSECVLYYPAWCGDGVLDSTYGETCDDGNNTSGDGCDATCKIEPPPVTTCDNLTASPVSGYNPFSSVLTCAGTNATSYSIDCGNGQIINSSNGTCNYTSTGTYNASCKVNGNITSGSCSRTIMSLTPPPPPSCNALSISPNTGNSPLTSTFTCQGINATGYKIEIKNSDGTVINTINNTTGTGNYTFSNAGNYSATCTINSAEGDKTSPSCNGNITVNTPSVCERGSLTLPLTGTINSSTTGLCKPGFSVGNFVGNTSGTITNYTWSCGGISGGNCSASYDSSVIINPSCNNLSISPSTGNSPLTSSFTCQGTNATGYKIEIKNNAGTVINVINNTTGTGNYTFSNAGNYSATCTISSASGDKTSPSCNGNITVNTPPIVTPTCNNLTVTPSTGAAPLTSNFSCSGSGSITSYKIDIFSGSTATGIALRTINNSTGSYVFNTNGTYSAKCTLNGSISSTSCQKDGTINVGNCERGSLTLPLTGTINSSTSGLCKPGFTVGSFTGITTGTTTNYTWSCGGISGGNCSASYTQPLTSGCTSLSFTKDNGNISFDSDFTCTGPTATGTTYRVVITNSDGLETNKANSSTGTFSFRSAGTYTARCYVNGETTASASCTKTITATSSSSSSSSSSGGGSSGGSCYSLNVLTTNGNTVSFDCKGSASNYTIDIREDPTGINKLLQTFTNIGGTYNFPAGKKYSAQCYVGAGNYTDLVNCKKTFDFTTSSSSSSSSSSGGGGSYCGDGNIDRPNKNGFYEECDNGNRVGNTNCNKNCSIDVTKPNGGIIDINPKGYVVLGDKMNVFDILGVSSFNITNNSTVTDFYSTGTLCMNNKSPSLITTTNNKLCSSTIGWLAKNSGKKEIIISQSYIANTSGIPLGQNFADGQIITTLDGLENTNSFLNAVLNVRVSKSSVSVRGGGASFVSNTSISDVNKLATGSGGGKFGTLDPNKNKNVVLTSLGNSQLSSYTKTESGTTINQLSKNQGTKDSSSFSGVNTNISVVANVINSLPNITYNSLENVFIHKGNVNINSNLTNSLTGNTTYIIEGNLNINSDITSSKNILFVVKGGDINIKNNVSKIDAVLIVLNGGKINGESISTNNQLTVNGALYGDVSDLIAKRTYIKGVGDYVNVGTNINFTSKIFTSPPPLLSKFLGDYTQSKKIPK